MITRLLACFAAGLLLAGSALSAEPFQFRASVDRDSITVGDPFLLNLSLELPENVSPEVIPDIGLPETFRVLGADDAVRESLGGGRDRMVQSIRLTTYRLGEVSIQDLRLQIVPEGGDTLILSDDPISILVQSVKPDSLNDIMDVKAPVSVEAVVPVWAWGTLALVVLIAVIAYLLWRRKRGQQSALPAPVVIVDWLAEVRKLLASELIPKSEFNAYYTQLSEALRRFVEQKTGADVMERTTFEVRSDLNAVGMAESRILEIEGFLNEADLVKFAKFEPDAGRAVTDGKRVLALMETIDREYAVAIESEEVVPS